MSRNYAELPNGYQDSIRRGVDGFRNFKSGFSTGTGSREAQVLRLKEALAGADAILIGAGAGLSTAAGLTYSGARFARYFSDFAATYGIQDIYAGGFFPFPDAETRWAWWARHIYFNRYVQPPKATYADLLRLVRERDYFVITTNVDHQFQRAGFDKKRLFYTQGDYGLFQSVNPAIRTTFDNEAWVMRAMAAQGFVQNARGEWDVPAHGQLAMRIPTALIPTCPVDGSAVVMNLRSDGTFLEDEGWHIAAAAYADFLKRQAGRRVLLLEIGVGSNTPVIIKYPFWQMAYENPNAVYACLNYDEAYCPKALEKQSVCIEGDANAVIAALGA